MTPEQVKRTLATLDEVLTDKNDRLLGAMTMPKANGQVLRAVLTLKNGTPHLYVENEIKGKVAKAEVTPQHIKGHVTLVCACAYPHTGKAFAEWLLAVVHAVTSAQQEKANGPNRENG